MIGHEDPADDLLQAHQALVEKAEESGQSQDGSDGLKNLHEAVLSGPVNLARERNHCSALGSGKMGSSIFALLVPVMTRTEAVVPTRSLTSSGTSTK